MALSEQDTQKLEKLIESMDARDRHLERTTDIVSKFAYLIGVRKSVFENPNEAPQLSWYEQLDVQKRARIVRNLCSIRTALEHNFGKINDGIRNHYRTIHSMTEYIPQESVLQLSQDGVMVFRKNNPYLGQYIIDINRLISDRINNCKDLFPTWLNWDYLKSLFIMPEGLSEEGIKRGANEFFTHLEYYPYSVYMNWAPYDCGNILYSDKRFVTLLYEWNYDQFTQLNKVEDAGDYVTGNIYDFIENGKTVYFLVDCENSNPYNLCAALEALDQEYRGKVAKVILFDDVHTSTAWQILDEYVSIPVERVLIERIKENKSLVDIRLAMRVSQEHYKNNVDSFVLVSSDSDYWGVISSLPEARFLLMVEHGKCGPDMRDALDENGIFYCYIDEFHVTRSDGIMKDALNREMQQYIMDNLQFNFYDMLDDAIAATRIEMTDAEKKQFFDKHIRPFQTDMDQDGTLMLHLKWQ